MVTREDLEVIKEELDERYVKQRDCEGKQEQVNKRFSNDDKRIEIISHDFDIIKKLMWAVASASIGSLVVAVFELILK
jgi:hypothetical protein